MLSRGLRGTAWLVALGAALSACDGVGLLRATPLPPGEAGGGPSSGGSSSAGGSGGSGAAGNGCPEAGPPAAANETAFYLWSYDGSGAVIQWSPTRQIVLASALHGTAHLTVTRDATKLAFRQQDNRTILLLTTDNPSSPEVIAELERLPRSLQFSPDGRWLAYTHDDNGGEAGIWVIPACGGLPKQLFAGAVVSAFAWRPDTADGSAHLVLHSDSLYAVDASATIPAPVDLLSGVSAAIADGVPVFDAAGRVYFRADMEPDGALRLYRSALDGSLLEEVPAAAGFTHGGGAADIGAVGVSRDGTQLAFAVDAPTEHLFQIYLAPIAGGPAAAITNVAIAQPADDTGPDPTAPIVWSNDSLHLAVRADWPLPDTVGDDYWSAFVVPTNGTGPVRVFKSPGSFDAGARQIAFSSNSARVFSSGFLDPSFSAECWALTTADFTIPDQALVPIHNPPEGRCEIVLPP